MKELNFIQTELKDWFLQRRFAIERNMALKKTLDGADFTGLAMNNSQTPEAQKKMWGDLVQGKPEIEDSLSANAKQMKVDMYTTMFKDATDLDHPCRVPGSTYLRCLSDNFKDTGRNREMKCLNAFQAFDGCRKNALQ